MVSGSILGATLRQSIVTVPGPLCRRDRIQHVGTSEISLSVLNTLPIRIVLALMIVAAFFTLEKFAAEEDDRDREVDDETGHVDECGHERRRGRRRVDSQAAQHEWK